jgi:hypothetical protein
MTPKSDTRIPEPQTRNPNSGTPNPKPGTRIPEPRNRNRKQVFGLNYPVDRPYERPFFLSGLISHNVLTEWFLLQSFHPQTRKLIVQSSLLRLSWRVCGGVDLRDVIWWILCVRQGPQRYSLKLKTWNLTPSTLDLEPWDLQPQTFISGPQPFHLNPYLQPKSWHSLHTNPKRLPPLCEQRDSSWLTTYWSESTLSSR